MLLRDGAEGLEVFMVTRQPAMWFSSALVYPGGKMDPADTDPLLIDLCRGATGLTADQAALRICAIRETFEETGILLACEGDSGTLVNDVRRAQLEQHYRAKVHAGEITLYDMAVTENLTLAVNLLVPFAHWITPKEFPRRFDTHFYLAPAPAGQTASHDHHEAADSVWIRPAVAIAEAEAGDHALMLVTRVNLAKAGRSRTTQEALDAARAATIVTVNPPVDILEEGVVYYLPEEADYGLTEGFEPKLFPSNDKGRAI
ncbi:MAG: NUDIX hydrolase [Rhodospirillaceae bacterium]|nr:NUDIX hydrolase [Rhodospirillaceae bacterium]